MDNTKLTKDAVLRIGEVSEVNGRKVFIQVDKNKNLSDLFFEGNVLKNIAVNSYVEIRKGFLSIIGKVEGEKIDEDFVLPENSDYQTTDRSKRKLTVSLFGFISQNGTFTGGTKELPLVGNEAYIVTSQKLKVIHNLVRQDSLSINIATAENDDLSVEFPVDGLFNSHIAIFGNTGSGKSNTLACLYQELFKTLDAFNEEDFRRNTRFILFDFNGEYAGDNCISRRKKVVSLSTQTSSGGDKIVLDPESILDVELLAILVDATDKTQKPFLKRAVSLYRKVINAENPTPYFQGVLKKQVTQVLQLSDKIKAFLARDYIRNILTCGDGDSIAEAVDVDSDLDWHNQSHCFYLKNSGFASSSTPYFQSEPSTILNTKMYQAIDEFEFEENLVSNLVKFLYVQLISDILSNRAQNEHISHVINRLKSKQKDISKLFQFSETEDFWADNFVVIDLNKVNLEMKKTIPLLLSKKLYSEHKKENNRKSLNLIIDEAHNILSRESFRESESWKDYRLETFEEIIKEGRKFGVFVTISSQRPNDISATITSQAHNYFIHRLINQRDLATISSAVSYIDKLTEESIPTLPTGTCIFSGVASQMPLKIQVKELSDNLKPTSHTLTFSTILSRGTTG